MYIPKDMQETGAFIKADDIAAALLGDDPARRSKSRNGKSLRYTEGLTYT